MERRDRIILQKVLSEIDIAREMMGGCTLKQFKGNEMLMRAVGMTVINIAKAVDADILITDNKGVCLYCSEEGSCVHKSHTFPSKVLLETTPGETASWRVSAAKKMAVRWRLRPGRSRESSFRQMNRKARTREGEAPVISRKNPAAPTDRALRAAVAARLCPIQASAPCRMP